MMGLPLSPDQKRDVVRLFEAAVTSGVRPRELDGKVREILTGSDRSLVHYVIKQGRLFLQVQRAMASLNGEVQGPGGRVALRKSGGPYIGPRGGKWADPQHKIAWDPNGYHATRKRRTGAMHVSEAQIHDLGEKLIAKIPGEVGKTKFIDTQMVPGPRGTIPVKVYVKTVPGMLGALSGAFGKTSDGRPVVIVNMPHGQPYQTMGPMIRNVLAHELTHAIDPTSQGGSSYKHDGKGGVDDEGEYYNSPEEIAAHLQEVARELATPHAKMFLRLPMFRDNPAKWLGTASSTYKQVKPHLTTESRKRFLRAAAIAHTHLLEGGDVIKKSIGESAMDEAMSTALDALDAVLSKAKAVIKTGARGGKITGHRSDGSPIYARKGGDQPKAKAEDGGKGGAAPKGDDRKGRVPKTLEEAKWRLQKVQATKGKGRAAALAQAQADVDSFKDGGKGPGGAGAKGGAPKTLDDAQKIKAQLDEAKGHAEDAKGHAADAKGHADGAEGHADDAQGVAALEAAAQEAEKPEAAQEGAQEAAKPEASPHGKVSPTKTDRDPLAPGGEELGDETDIGAASPAASPESETRNAEVQELRQQLQDLHEQLENVERIVTSELVPAYNQMKAELRDAYRKTGSSGGPGLVEWIAHRVSAFVAFLIQLTQNPASVASKFSAKLTSGAVAGQKKEREGGEKKAPAKKAANKDTGDLKKSSIVLATDSERLAGEIALDGIQRRFKTTGEAIASIQAVAQRIEHLNQLQRILGDRR